MTQQRVMTMPRHRKNHRNHRVIKRDVHIHAHHVLNHNRPDRVTRSHAILAVVHLKSARSLQRVIHIRTKSTVHRINIGPQITAANENEAGKEIDIVIQAEAAEVAAAVVVVIDHRKISVIGNDKCNCQHYNRNKEFLGNLILSHEYLNAEQFLLLNDIEPLNKMH